MHSEIILFNIICDTSGIKIFYQGAKFKYAWLENTNKYIPDVINLAVNVNEQYILINLNNIAQHHQFKNKKNLLKLSISADFSKVTYKGSENFRKLISRFKNKGVKFFKDDKDTLMFHINVSDTVADKNCNFEKVDLFFPKSFRKKTKFMMFSSAVLPLKIIVIGSCFSRSIFRSSAYFNPRYKDFFDVVYTSFHNSLISMMSQSINNDEYLQYNDLTIKEIQTYVAMEFDKNISEYLDKYQPDLIIIDNYIEATASIIQFSTNNFLTYNKYLAESIFKKNFSHCDVIYPGTVKHIELLNQYMRQFAIEIEKRNLSSKVILLGSRLSEKMINLSTGEVRLWSDKMEWIQTSNQNWDYADQIFLECMPNSHYIDMRSTSWLSDIDSPIIGGASPSHYQNEYYKEIFDEILKLTVNKA